MFWNRAVLVASLCLCAAAPVSAHPHVFADTGYHLIFDAGGRLARIRTRWLYDDFFTLTMVEDKKADANGDGDISADELKTLADFDSEWPDDYDGDLHVSQNGKEIAAGPPHDWSVDWKDGRLSSIHTRDFDPALDLSKGPVRISPYDPGYYVAYTVVPEPVIDGRTDCRTEHLKPDIDAEAKKVADEIAATPPDVNLADMGYLDVGQRFAETVVLTCGN
jgi:ABC-type uncharacterized transport system substrate-binding protein